MSTSSSLIKSTLSLALAGAALVSLPSRADLSIGNNPLYLVAGKANVLMVLDNSNSMDEAPSGEAVGSASAASKSEIARGVIRNLTTDYQSRINMGLMAYRQSTPAASYIHTSPYDASYNPGNYDPTWTGSRSSATHKRFRIPNPTSPGNFIHYNVALPFYADSNQGTAFCYSNTADASNNFVNGGPYPDTYRCFGKKTGTSDTPPTWRNNGSESAQGYGNFQWENGLTATDSDVAQGISDFGKQLTWSYVDRAWQASTSPGRGYLWMPIKDLSSTQGQAIRDKLTCNVPGNPGSCTSTGIPNAGNTPIEGTLLTARDYFKGSSATWSVAAEGYVSSCYPLPQSCGKNFVVLLTDGLPSTDKNGNSVSDPATALAAATSAAATLKAAGIETYVIGMALPYGVDPTTLNQIAVAGGTDTAYNASDSASLAAAFKTVFDDILRKTSAFGAISQNSTAINAGSRIYQARFDSTDWSGEIAALQPDISGNMTTIWSTSDSGRVPAAAARKVYTLKPGTGGVEFKLLASLSTTQQAALTTPDCSAALTGNNCGQARIDWLRGDQTKEAAAGPLRKRSRLLGDFISASPFLVKDSNTLFAGANDGMLHAFNASTGNEIFAFIPNAVIGNLAALTNPVYTHQYLVDGELTVSSREDTPNQNILVGSLGRGGKALYALDVSNPASFGAASVLWEFTDPDLGLVLNRPFITRLNNGRPAVIVGNGVNSANQRAFLFIVDALTGALIKKIDTGAGGSSATNGLSSPRGWDADANGTVDTVYAGDLLGNVWKFDLSSTSAGSWDVAFKSSGANAPLFVATDASGKRQPITGSVGVGINPRKGDPNYGKRFVFVGTGRYIVSADVVDASVQSWYGLIDDGTAISGRSVLLQRTIEVESGSGAASKRGFSNAVAGDMAGRRGWVVDLKSPSSGALGERIIGESKLFGQVLLATSLLPTSDLCIPGGDGYLNAIDPFSGGALAIPFFDVNSDALFTDADRIGSDKRAVGSINPQVNLPGDAVLIGNQLIVSGTSGTVGTTGVNNPVRSGRIAWREIVR